MERFNPIAHRLLPPSVAAAATAQKMRRQWKQRGNLQNTENGTANVATKSDGVPCCPRNGKVGVSQ